MADRDCPPTLKSGLLYYLWLLRRDVTSGWEAGNPASLPRFLCWWVLFGRREYPNAQRLPPEHKAWLIATDPSLPQNTFIPVTRLMVLLSQWCDDRRERYSLTTLQGRTECAIWFLSLLAEYDLDDFVSDEQHQALARPGAGLAEGLTPLNSRMLLDWRRNPYAPQMFPLDTVTRRERYASWHAANRSSSMITGLARDSERPQPAATCPRPFGVNLIGFAQGEFGIGEDVRMAARACKAAKIPFTIFNIVASSVHRAQDQSMACWFSDDLPFAANLFCMTAFDTAEIHLRHGAERFSGYDNIGYWPWELPGWPIAWAPVFELVDEVWSSSRFTQAAMAGATAKSVRHMPMAVEAQATPGCHRGRFDLGPGDFVFLSVFDWNSYFTRKNPHAVVTAFQAAFPDNADPVTLILKTMGGRPDDPCWTEFAARVAGDRRIRLVNEV